MTVRVAREHAAVANRRAPTQALWDGGGAWRGPMRRTFEVRALGEAVRDVPGLAADRAAAGDAHGVSVGVAGRGSGGRAAGRDGERLDGRGARSGGFRRSPHLALNITGGMSILGG